VFVTEEVGQKHQITRNAKMLISIYCICVTVFIEM
jgi:hypothetical protein